MTRCLLVALPTLLLSICGSTHAFVQQNASPPSVSQTNGASTVDSSEAASPPTVSVLSRSSIGVWGAGSLAQGNVLGKLSKGWIGLFGLRYQRLLIPATNEDLHLHDAATLTYTADVVPLAALSIPKGIPAEAPSSAIQSVKETGLSTYGVGVYPLGLQVGFRPSASFRPFVAGHTGLFYFYAPLPDERGRQLNFAAGVGGGVTISLTSQTTLTLGYRYHHLSNGFRGSINPGLDANLLYVGIGLSP